MTTARRVEQEGQYSRRHLLPERCALSVQDCPWLDAVISRECRIGQ
jgi:hypothetical protein